MVQIRLTISATSSFVRIHKRRKTEGCQVVIDFPDPRTAPDDCDLLAVSHFGVNGSVIVAPPGIQWPKLTDFGSSWSPEVLIEAYRRGLFPMPFEIDGEMIGIGWWSPAERAIFYPDRVRVSRSLRKDLPKFTVTFNKDFEAVMRACADPSRPLGWITDDVVSAYLRLHAMGAAHSVEVWLSGELVGGLYGVAIGGVFAGESMFHKVTNASKVALVHLAAWLNDGHGRVIDSQWLTTHLESLGAVRMPRSEYCDLVSRLALNEPPKLPV